MWRSAVFVLLTLAACGGPRRVAIRVLVPDLGGVETPLPGVVVAALPYDRDSVLRVLESRAATRRPHTQALDSLFQAFRGPFSEFARLAWQVDRLRHARDSVARLRDAAAGTPGRGELDRRVAALDDSLARRQPDLERARTTLAAARDTLWPRMERLRDSVRRWEVSTYAGYDTIVRRLVQDRLRTGIADTTGATGWAELHLRSGNWWIYARSPDPGDPNMEWYWNVPAEGDTLRLTTATGRHHPRY
jgi:hypothetical protein